MGNAARVTGSILGGEILVVFHLGDIPVNLLVALSTDVSFTGIDPAVLFHPFPGLVPAVAEIPGLNAVGGNLDLAFYRELTGPILPDELFVNEILRHAIPWKNRA